MKVVLARVDLGMERGGTKNIFWCVIHTFPSNGGVGEPRKAIAGAVSRKRGFFEIIPRRIEKGNSGFGLGMLRGLDGGVLHR